MLDGDVPLATRVHHASADMFERHPTVVVMGSWLTVKEQMADRYAAALAAKGYDALTFDFAGFGASGGALRQAEVPTRKMSNLAAVVEFATTLSMTGPGGIGVVAVCASAQYTLAAMARGLPIASFASVAGWFHDTTSVAPFYGGEDGVRSRLGRAATAAAEFLRSGRLTTVPAYATDDDRAGMTIEMDYYADSGRGAVTTWRNEMAELTWTHWLGFDGLSAAAAVSVPALFVHSEAAVLPDNVRAVAHRLNGPVELLWVDGEQTDFYDQPSQVKVAVDAIDAHFMRTLAGAR